VDQFYYSAFLILLVGTTAVLILGAIFGINYAIPTLWLWSIAVVLFTRFSPWIDPWFLTYIADPAIAFMAFYLILEKCIFPTVDNATLQKNLADALQNMDEDRRNLVAALHDKLNPLLVLARLEVEDIHRLLNSDTSRLPVKELTQHTNSAHDIISQAYKQSREIVSGLDTEAIDTLGLSLSIQSMVSKYGAVVRQPKITFTTDETVSELALPVEISTNFYRIAQESVFNAIKHSNSKTIDVSLQVRNGTLILSIKDRGKGLSSWSLGNGIGIISMRERALKIGADFDIKSGPSGVQTTLRKQLPPPPPRTNHC
jgi:two-component system NarL family sensor kinase